MNAITTRGYWCECWIENDATGNTPAILATYDATTATEAARWIRVALLSLTTILQDDARTRVRTFLHRETHTATDVLTRGQPYAFIIDTASTRIAWTARPVHFLTLADRHGKQLPACAGQFTPHPEGT